MFGNAQSIVIGHGKGILTLLMAGMLSGSVAGQGTDPPDPAPVPAPVPTSGLAAAGEEPEPAKPGPAILVHWNREIAVFRSQDASLSPTERAARAGARLDELAEQLATGTLRIETAKIGSEPGVRFLVGDEFLFALVESDLDELSGEKLSVVSDEVLGRLKEDVAAREEQKDASVLLRGLGISLAATVVLVVVIWLLLRISHGVANLMERWIKKWRSLKFRRFDLRSYLILAVKRVIILLGWVGILAVTNVWLTEVLSQFPITAPVGGVLGDHLARLTRQFGAGVLAAIPGLLAVIIIMMVARWASRLADHLIRSMGETGGDDAIMAGDTAKATRRIVVVLIWIFAVVVAYPYLPGSGSDAFKGISMLLGLMISLGSTGMINQVMSGFVMLYSGSIRTGEYARIGNIEGTITEMGMLATKILTPKREFITVLCPIQPDLLH